MSHLEEMLEPRETFPPIGPDDSAACVSLWFSVILQMMYDLATESNQKCVAQRKADARKWLRKSSDFQMVCDLANVSPDLVMRQFEKIESAGRDGFNGQSLRREIENRMQKESRQRPV